MTGTISLGLKDPGTQLIDILGNPVGAQDGRIDLNELFTALQLPSGDITKIGDNLAKLIDSPSITGSADVNLNSLQATPDTKLPSEK